MKYLLYSYLLLSLLVVSIIRAGGCCSHEKHSNEGLAVQSTRQAYNLDSTKIPMKDLKQFGETDEEKRNTWGGSFGASQLEVYNVLVGFKQHNTEQSQQIKNALVRLKNLNKEDFEHVCEEIQNKYNCKQVDLSILEKNLQSNVKDSQSIMGSDRSIGSFASSQCSEDQTNKLVSLNHLQSILIFFKKAMILEDVKNDLIAFNGVDQVFDAAEYSITKKSITSLIPIQPLSDKVSPLALKEKKEYEFPEELKFEED